jgi:dinuclear metal center YbgI/SA1388 family protein
MATAREIATELDAYLRTNEVADYPHALNGLQVDSDREVTRVAIAVDARESTIRRAVDMRASLLVVHHGLFWGGLLPLTGAHLRRVRALLGGDLALYSSHLPLDAHTEVGNSLLLARALGLTPSSGFAETRGVELGVAGLAELPTAELVDRVRTYSAQHATHVVHTALAEGRTTRRWAICTGAGVGPETLREARERGIDTFISGEAPHWAAIDAEEAGITLILAGHYASETLGVKALGARVKERYGVEWEWIEEPTGI